MTIGSIANIPSLLLENKSVKQTILKNTFWLGFAGVIEKAAALILLIWVARILGATEYGKFTFALAFVSLFGVIFNFGLRPIITREFARAREKEKEFAAVLSLKIILSIVGIFLIFASSFFITNDPAIQTIIWILAVYILGKSFSGIIFAFFQARERMEYQAFTRIFEAFLLLGFGLFVIFTFPSAINLGFSYALSMVMVFIAGAAILHFKVQRFTLQWNPAVWKKFIIMSWPLALIAAFTAMYNQIDSVMMGSFGQITETGWYNAAYKIVYGSLILMGFISNSFYPVLSRTFKESKEKLQRIWNAQMEIMVFLAFPITVGGITLAPAIISTVYGSDFIAAVFALQLLMVSVGFMFIYDSFRQILIVHDQQKKFFLTALSGVILNVVLNLILIPKYSLYGAAVSTVFVHAFILLSLMRYTLKFTAVNPFNSRILLSLLGAVMGTAIMYSVVSQTFLSNLHVLYLIFIGAVVYFTFVWGYKKATRNIIHS